LLRTILNRKQSQLLKDEKAALEQLQLALAGFEVTLEDQKTLQKSIQQLDELFLLVVVGEFNSGKSAFINALLGERFLEEGVTPTTAQICILHHGESASREVAEDGVLTLSYPAAFLREINIVDTPGTNAIIRQKGRGIDPGVCSPQRPGDLYHLRRPALYRERAGLYGADPGVGQEGGHPAQQDRPAGGR
jgi:hypothetical protein